MFTLMQPSAVAGILCGDFPVSNDMNIWPHTQSSLCSIFSFFKPVCLLHCCGIPILTKNSGNRGISEVSIFLYQSLRDTLSSAGERSGKVKPVTVGYLFQPLAFMYGAALRASIILQFCCVYKKKYCGSSHPLLA